MRKPSKASGTSRWTIYTERRRVAKYWTSHLCIDSLGFCKECPDCRIITLFSNYHLQLPNTFTRKSTITRCFRRKSDANPITIALQNNYKSIIEIFCQKKSLLSATIFSTFLVYVMLYNFLKIRYLYTYKCFKIYFFQFYRFNVYSLWLILLPQMKRSFVL